MENQNLDNDNVFRIWLSVYANTSDTMKASFGIWDTPGRNCFKKEKSRNFQGFRVHSGRNLKSWEKKI